MKAIVCEMCNSQDLVKQDGMYICQSCGTKYSTEDAKKLMVEIDNSKKLNNLYERARQSLDVDDLEHAAEYFKQILDENPNDWEAYFYSYLGEFPSFTNAQAGSVASKLGNTIPAAYDMAIVESDITTTDARVNTITTKTVERLRGIAATGASLLRKYEGGAIATAAGKVNNQLYFNIRPTALNTIVSSVLSFDPLDQKVSELIKEGAISEEAGKKNLLLIRKAQYEIANMTFAPHATSKEKLVKPEKIQEYAQKIKDIDPSFEIPAQEPPTTSSPSGGCYVATAVYGSYDCPQVWTLRRYRDYTLAETWYGRAFIHTYYAVSPTLVKWFGKTAWFRKLWQPRLDRMVERLNAEGVENTPYADRDW